MRKEFRFALGGLALMALNVAALAGELGVGFKAPSLPVAKWIKGKPVDLNDGKVHVVEFWATWCGPCKVSIPHLTELQKKYQGKVNITGVSIWEEKAPADESYIAKVEDFVKEWAGKMEYTVAVDGKEGKISKAWIEAAEGNGIPTSFVVKNGKVLWIGHPMMGLDKVLDEVLAGTFDADAAAAKDAARRSKAREQRELMAPINEALKSGDTAKAISLIDDRIAKDPRAALGLGMTKFNLLLKTDEAKAQAWAKELSEGAAKDNPNMLNALAWTLVDDKSPVKNPDLNLAIAIAERGLKALKGDDKFAPYLLDTYAYALYKNGQIDKAYDFQARAVAQAEGIEGFKAETLKELRERLDLFRTKKKTNGGGG